MPDPMTPERLAEIEARANAATEALAADDLHAILSAILDLLEEQQAEQLGRFTDDEPEPEPDYGPRPAGCCGACPPVLGGGDDCTCANSPRCAANKADRIDCYGNRWVWCDRCDGFRMDGHGLFCSGAGWSAEAELDEGCGPLTPTTDDMCEQYGDHNE